MITIARRYVRPGLSFASMLDAARDGLLRAWALYDPARGSFAPFARKWMRHTCQRRMAAHLRGA